MATAVFYDKVGGSEALIVAPGQTIADVLRASGIPRNAVLTRLNGTIVSEEASSVKPSDHIEFYQVRHYDLSVTRTPSRRVHASPDPVYTKSVVFDTGRDFEVRAEQFDTASFTRFVENAFVETLRSGEVIHPGSHIVTGLSGGRDSVALLQLIQRTQKDIPAFQMTIVTVAGMPDWEEPATFKAAIDACRLLDLPHIIVNAEEIEQCFRLTRPFEVVMQTVLDRGDHHMIMVIGHHVLRRMVEVVADRAGSREIALGFNADDLLASVITWMTAGYAMGGIPRRTIGRFSYLFPLYRITKKELTLYLELAAPSLNRQGSPGRFTTGPAERSLSYAIADHLLDLWPGFDYYAFQGFQGINPGIDKIPILTCSICQGEFLDIKGGRYGSRLCDVCGYFVDQELAHE